MAGRFTVRRVAAPEPPVDRRAGAGRARTARPGRRLPEVPAEQAPPVQPQAGQSAAQRQAARRQGAPASPADRGDQSFGAGKAAGGGNPPARPAAGVAIRAGRAAGAQHPGARRLRLGNSRRDDRPGSARAAAQGREHQRHPDQRPRMRLCRAPRRARAAVGALQGRAASAAHHQQDRVRGRPPRRRIASALRRAPAGRLARQRGGAADRRRRPAGLDPQILQEAAQPRASWSRSARCARRWPSCWRRR